MDGKNGSEKGCDLLGVPEAVAAWETVSVGCTVDSLRMFLFDREIRASVRRQLLQIMMVWEGAGILLQRMVMVLAVFEIEVQGRRRGFPGRIHVTLVYSSTIYRSPVALSRFENNAQVNLGLREKDGTKPQFHVTVRSALSQT